MRIYVLFLYLIFTVFSAQAADSIRIKLDLYFKSGQTNLKLSKRHAVEDLYQILRDYPNAKVEILGYADSSGSKDLNMEVSRARAFFIKNKLVKKGVLEGQVSVKGLGESFRDDNRTPEGRAKNRRVEVVVIEEDVSALRARLSEVKSLSLVTNGEAVSAKKSQNKIEADDEENFKKTKSWEDEHSNGQVDSNYAVLRYRLEAGGYENTLSVTPLGGASEDWESSRTNLVVGGAFQVQVSNLWIGLKAYGHSENYTQGSDLSDTWDEQTPFLMRAGLILDYEKSKWGLGADLSFNQESFVYRDTGITGSVVELRDEMLTGLSLRGKYKWLNKKTYSSRFYLKLDMPFSGNGDIGSKGKLGYELAFDLQKKIFSKGKTLGLKVFYQVRNFENNQNDQEENLLGLMLSFNSDLWL